MADKAERLQMLTNVPIELKEHPQWVGYRLEPSASRPGKTDKIPLNAHTGNLASSTDPATWAAYPDAVTFAYNTADCYGVGFVLSDTDPYAGIDLDGCIDAIGIVQPWAREIIQTVNSYTETSPSGTGLRIFVRAKLPPKGRRKGAVEMYETTRFLTVTGDHLAGTPTTIEERTNEVATVHTNCIASAPKQKQQTKNATPQRETLDDTQLWERMFASKKGTTIRALHAGDTSAHNNDPSTADLALCNHLAFWTGKDAQQMDSMFRQSKLYRPKWDERHYANGETHGQHTISKAIEDCTDVYTGADDPMSRIIHNAGASGIDLQTGEMIGATRLSCSDLGNARRLIQHHGTDLHFVYLWGKWFIWDGSRWVEDETGEIERRAKATVATIYAEAALCSDDKTRKDLGKWALTSESQNKISAMVALAKSEPGIPIKHDDLDKDPWLLNCRNGIIDLRTGKLLPHDRSHLCTKRIEIDYEPNAQCPRWESFLAEIMDGDQEMVDFLQRADGYSLTGDVSEQCLFFNHGAGENGKSTYLETKLALLGEYAQKAPTEMIMLKAHTGAVPNDVARLVGKRFVVTAEIEGERRLAESLVKDLTGGDRLVARFMRQEFFEFDPVHKLWIYGNHKPIIRGTDKGIWRRIHLIPFLVQFSGDKKDPQLKDKLRVEMPGILAWMVRGCLDWQSKGLQPPAKVTEATNEYRSEMDVIAAFIEECCVINPNAQVGFAELYNAYRQYCEQYREHYERQRKFGDRLTERGIRPDRGHANKAMRRGIGLVTQVTQVTQNAVYERESDKTSLLTSKQGELSNLSNPINSNGKVESVISYLGKLVDTNHPQAEQAHRLLDYLNYGGPLGPDYAEDMRQLANALGVAERITWLQKELSDYA